MSEYISNKKKAHKRLSDYYILLFLSGFGMRKKEEPQKRKAYMGLGTGGGCLL